MPDLNEIAQRMDGVRRGLVSVAETVPAEHWQKRPAPDSWSAAEVIAHLSMVDTAVADGMERTLQHEAPPAPFWKRLHVPPKVVEWRFPKARTPIPLDSSLLAEKETMLERFRAGRERILAVVNANRHRDLSRWRFPHPFFGSYNMHTWLKMLYHHEIRHTKQLREIARSIS